MIKMEQPKNCKQCGKEFIRKQQHQIYCSKECRLKIRNKKHEEQKKKNYKGPINILCKQCGKSFIRKQGHNNQLYCSLECRKIYYEEQKKIVFFDIFEHDNFRCQYCGKTPADGIKLVVDHIFPVSKGGKSDRFNLTTACSECNGSKMMKILSLKEIIRRWDLNPKKFTYMEAKEYWGKLQSKREDYNNGA